MHHHGTKERSVDAGIVLGAERREEQLLKLEGQTREIAEIAGYVVLTGILVYLFLRGRK